MAVPGQVPNLVPDQCHLQWWGFRYLNKNKYHNPNEKRDLKQEIRRLLEGRYYSNSPDAPGPTCNCVTDNRGVKCTGTECTVRQIKFECPSSCGAQCGNKIFTGDQFVQTLQVGGIDGYGLCLVTTAAIQAGLPVVEMIGKIKKGKIRRNHMHAYPISMFEDTVPLYLSQSKEGNESRFIQHSIDPNCIVEEWVVGREIRLLVVAVKVINPGEAITVTFPQREQECYAGSKEPFLKEYYLSEDEGKSPKKIHPEIKPPQNEYEVEWRNINDRNCLQHLQNLRRMYQGSVGPYYKCNEAKQKGHKKVDERCTMEFADLDSLARHYRELHMPRVDIPAIFEKPVRTEETRRRELEHYSYKRQEPLTVEPRLSDRPSKLPPPETPAAAPGSGPQLKDRWDTPSRLSSLAKRGTPAPSLRSPPTPVLFGAEQPPVLSPAHTPTSTSQQPMVMDTPRRRASLANREVTPARPPSLTSPPTPFLFGANQPPQLSPPHLPASTGQPDQAETTDEQQDQESPKKTISKRGSQKK